MLKNGHRLSIFFAAGKNCIAQARNVDNDLRLEMLYDKRTLWCRRNQPEILKIAICLRILCNRIYYIRTENATRREKSLLFNCVWLLVNIQSMMARLLLTTED